MINPQRVTELMKSCFFENEEIIDGKPVVEPVFAEGIVTTFGFHPERIKAATAEVRSMLEQLPDEFKNGSSFLNLCMDKDGKQWTGEHKVCEQLVVLGIGTGQMAHCAPREMWSALPGGMPYVMVKLEEGPT